MALDIALVAHQRLLTRVHDRIGLAGLPALAGGPFSSVAQFAAHENRGDYGDPVGAGGDRHRRVYVTHHCRQPFLRPSEPNLERNRPCDQHSAGVIR